MLFYKGFEDKIQNFIANNKNYSNRPATHNLMLFATDKSDTDKSDGDGDEEMKMYYRFDMTGHVMIATTETNENAINPDVKELFQKATVFLGALTGALGKKNKTLYDYEAVNAVLSKSGEFAGLGIEDRTFQSSSNELTLDADIIKIALAAVGNVSAAGTAFSVAQKVLNGLSEQIKLAASHQENDKKIGHLLIVCQDMMGAPLVNLTLFFVNATETTDVTKSNCHESQSQNITFQFHQQDYMFENPKFIEMYTKDFNQSPEYDKYVNKLADYIS